MGGVGAAPKPGVVSLPVRLPPLIIRNSRKPYFIFFRSSARSSRPTNQQQRAKRLAHDFLFVALMWVKRACPHRSFRSNPGALAVFFDLADVPKKKASSNVSKNFLSLFNQTYRKSHLNSTFGKSGQEVEASNFGLRARSPNDSIDRVSRKFSKMKK